MRRMLRKHSTEDHCSFEMSTNYSTANSTTTTISKSFGQSSTLEETCEELDANTFYDQSEVGLPMSLPMFQINLFFAHVIRHGAALLITRRIAATGFLSFLLYPPSFRGNTMCVGKAARRSHHQKAPSQCFGRLAAIESKGQQRPGGFLLLSLLLLLMMLMLLNFRLPSQSFCRQDCCDRLLRCKCASGRTKTLLTRHALFLRTYCSSKAPRLGA